MGRVVVAFAVLLLFGCGEEPGQEQTSRTATRSVTERVWVSRSVGTELRLGVETFRGAELTARATESEHVVRVSVTYPAQEYRAVAAVRCVAVTLDRPLGDRLLVDEATGYPLVDPRRAPSTVRMSTLRNKLRQERCR